MKICPCVFIQDTSFTASPPLSNVNQHFCDQHRITETLFIGFDLQLDSGIFIIRKCPNFNGFNSLSTVYFHKVSHSSSTLCHFPQWEQIREPQYSSPPRSNTDTSFAIGMRHIFKHIAVPKLIFF